MKKGLQVILFFANLMLCPSASLYAQHDMHSDVTIQGQPHKKKSSFPLKKLIIASGVIVAGGAGGYYFFRKRQQHIPNKEIEDAVRILAQYPVKFINKFYQVQDFFEVIGKQPGEVILTDAANAKLIYGGGTTGGIWELRQAEYRNKQREVKELDGTKRELDNKAPLPGTKKYEVNQLPLKRPLERGEVVISTTGELTVAHLYGVGVNTPESREINAKGIRKIYQYGVKMNKSIVFCGFSAGNFASGKEQMAADMEANLLITLADEMKKTAQTKTSDLLPIDIFIIRPQHHRPILRKLLRKEQIINNALN